MKDYCRNVPLISRVQTAAWPGGEELSRGMCVQHFDVFNARLSVFCVLLKLKRSEI